MARYPAGKELASPFSQHSTRLRAGLHSFRPDGTRDKDPRMNTDQRRWEMGERILMIFDG